MQAIIVNVIILISCVTIANTHPGVAIVVALIIGYWHGLYRGSIK